MPGVDLAKLPPPVEPLAKRGKVSRAPSKVGDPFKVIVPDFDELHVFEIRYWMPRGEDLPAVGDAVLVVVDDNAEPWVIAWSP